MGSGFGNGLPLPILPLFHQNLSMSAKPFQIRTDPDSTKISAAGGICGGSAADFSRALVREALRLGEPEGEVCLEFEDLDLLDGAAVAETVNAIREILSNGRPMQIHRSPQMLAHTLYKTGMLKDGRITLIDPVEEESTAN